MCKYLLLTIFLTLDASAASNFDRMRCNGRLVYQGTSFEKVVKLCGRPSFAKKVGNQYVTYYKVAYDSTGRGKYFMLFKNGYLIRSELSIYGASKWAWKLPRGNN